MNLSKFTRQAVSAAVAGAMALSFSAPALAAVPPLPVFSAAALSEENVDQTQTVHIKEDTRSVEITVDSNGIHKVTLDGYEVMFESRSVTIDGSNGSDSSFKITVNVADGQTANITLNGVNIETSQYRALTVNGAADITLNGENTVKGLKAIWSSGNLTIGGSGSLEAKGNYGGNLGTIHSNETLTIKNGTVKAVNSNSEGCGISGVEVAVSGGQMDASGSTNGIRAVDDVSITGGSVKATNIHNLYGKADEVTLSGEAKVFLTSQTDVDSWNTDGLAGNGSGWLLYKKADGTVGGAQEGFVPPSLSDLENKDPAEYGNLPRDPDAATGYGITVTYRDGTPVAVKSENAGNVLGEGNPSITVEETTDAEGTPIYKLAGSNVNGSLKIDGSGAALPVDVELTASDGAYAVDGRLETNGVRNVTVKGSGENYAISNGATINCKGDVSITNDSYGAVGGTLTVQNARNVTVAGKNNTTIISDAIINCSGDVEITNPDSVAVGGYLKVCDGTDATAGDVTVEGSGDYYAINSGATINCTGDVSITNDSYGAVGWDGMTVQNARDVMIKGGSDRYTINGTTVINCTRDVKITSASYGAIGYQNLTVKNARNVTVETNGSIAISGTADITCSGRVQLSNESGRILGAIDKLTYTQSAGKAYTVKAGLSEEAAEQLDEAGAAGEKFELEPVPDDYHYICITPDGWVDPSDIPATPGTDNPDSDFGVDPVDDGSGIAGAVIAGAAIGGAAIWSGYEITTRVILSELLPAGAAIPKNQGELVLLLWLTAGKPEPEQEAPYADDTAKAAQWCVEQGWLDSTDTGKWMPKYKTIEVWKKAFPQQ